MGQRGQCELTLDQYFRELFWDFVVVSKAGLGAPTKFEFQHIPEQDKMLEMPKIQAPGTKGPVRVLEGALFGVFFIGCLLVLSMLFGADWLLQGTVNAVFCSRLFSAERISHETHSRNKEITGYQ